MSRVPHYCDGFKNPINKESKDYDWIDNNIDGYCLKGGPDV